MAKKKFDTDLFNDDSPTADIEAVDNAIFERGVKSNGVKRIVAKPIKIFELRADRKQPRRTVPPSVRGDWDGRADAVPGLLTKWRSSAEKELSREINVAHIFKGYEQEIDVDPKTQPVADKFLSLVNLASGIRREGLLNPIQINRIGNGGEIVAGERRWLAHHLLAMFSDEPKKWESIPAVDVEPDVWKQAQENGNRSPLNAIEMARQLALLIMDMYEGDDGVQFDSYDALVSPGGSDRPFYAQVADGMSYRIKRGFSDKIVEATGLKSRKQINHYRNLLNLDNETWVIADEENWTENYCRVNFLQKTSKDENNADMSTVVDISQGDMLSNDNTTHDGLQVGEGFSQSYSPPAKETTALIPVEVGQVRGADATNKYPYLVVMSKVGNVFWNCLIEFQDAEVEQNLSSANIVSGYQYLRGYRDVDPTPQPPPQSVGEGELSALEKTIYGVEVPLGDDVPDYPSGGPVVETGERRKSIYKGEADLTVEQDRPLVNPKTNRTPSTPPQLKSRSAGDPAGNIAFIHLHKELRQCLRYWGWMGNNMELGPSVKTMSKVYLLSPDSIREKVETGGIDAVKALWNEIIDAILHIDSEFLSYLEELKHDVFTIAESAAGVGDDAEDS